MKLIADLSARATRAQYFRAGIMLMSIKYIVDLIAYYLAFGRLWHPVDYLNPIFAQRLAVDQGAQEIPTTFGVFLVAWGLAFAWLGATWSARRAADAGLSAAWGLLLFVPFVNLALVLVLLSLPSAGLEREADARRERGQLRVSLLSLSGVVYFALMASLYGLLVEGMEGYGMASFVSLPLVIGIGIGVIVNQKRIVPLSLMFGYSLAFTFAGSFVLLLFALEGAICLLMVMPLLWATMFVGILLGSSLARMDRPRTTTTACVLLTLPLSSWIESQLPTPPAREVATSLEIDAPPDVVWRHVVEFSELPTPDDWMFHTGIAYPLRARIEGRGVGAIRHCEFSTGAFVEPITAWEEPQRLAFDVIDQPMPLEEWSFYANVSPPHLHTTFRSVRGEFRLIALEGGRTRLEGSTWYELDMAPQAYWRLFGDAVIHRIHRRVLRHVRALSEHDHAGR